MRSPSPTLHCPCERRHGNTVFTYDAPPEGETRFDLAGQEYRRNYWRCDVCGHFFSVTRMDLGILYSGAYVESTYGDSMLQTFERILALPPERSDNAGRVARVVAFAQIHFPVGRVANLLDVGSGLAVFPFRMRQAGFRCTALDPDPGAAAHAREAAGVDAILGDFMLLPADRLGRYDLITFNKVLEHVEDPVAMLEKARAILEPDGFVYLEVPDVAAAAEGPGREEFFIEHHHVFSPASLAIASERAGFSVVVMERLREPSTKFTLRAFLELSTRGLSLDSSSKERRLTLEP
jgi:SAM-dependent methyltransferase